MGSVIYSVSFKHTILDMHFLANPVALGRFASFLVLFVDILHPVVSFPLQ